MNLGKSLEDYLEAILILKNKNGKVYSVDIARYMDFSKPSVTHATKKLRKEGYLIMDEDGCLHLTAKGIALAEQLYERHRFFAERLTEMGVDPITAEKDACQMEHAVSDESFQKLKSALEK